MKKRIIIILCTMLMLAVGCGRTAVESDSSSWQDGYDKGYEDGFKAGYEEFAAIIDQISMSEVELVS